MTKEIRIRDADLGDMRQLIEAEVRDAIGPLTEELERLRRLHASMRDVITHREAPLFFGGEDEVKPETVIKYIKYCGLPAYKQGRIWYIQLRDLMDWQIGRIGHPPTKHIHVVAPRVRDRAESATMLTPTS